MPDPALRTSAEPDPPASIEILPLAPGQGVTIRVDRQPAPPLTRRELDAWTELLRDRPRLFDGAVYSVSAFDPATRHITLAHDSFARVCLGSARLLGVKAVVLGSDPASVPHVLINRRHPGTRVYGGLWEAGPGGGVSPRETPAVDSIITVESLAQHLSREGQEELGLDLARESDLVVRGPSMFLLDHAACSLDLVFVVTLNATIDPRAAACRAQDRDWEYLDSAWLSRADTPRFLQQHAHAIAPTLPALLHALHWLA